MLLKLLKMLPYLAPQKSSKANDFPNGVFYIKSRQTSRQMKFPFVPSPGLAVQSGGTQEKERMGTDKDSEANRPRRAEGDRTRGTAPERLPRASQPHECPNKECATRGGWTCHRGCLFQTARSFKGSTQSPWKPAVHYKQC